MLKSQGERAQMQEVHIREEGKKNTNGEPLRRGKEEKERGKGGSERNGLASRKHRRDFTLNLKGTMGRIGQ